MTTDPHDPVGPGLAAEGAVTWGTRHLDVAAWRFGSAAGAGRPVHATEAVAAAARMAGPAALRQLVVGVIGPRAATPVQAELARVLGAALAGLSLTVLCGGRGGVMEAVCQGVTDAGGLSIGLLPGHRPEEANAHVGIPLPTGLSEGRNMVIARASRVLIAVGGSYGTLTEMAYGLHFGKRVVALDDAPPIEGLTRAADVTEAIELCCDELLRQALPKLPAS